MEYQINEHDNTLNIHLSGRLTFRDAAAFDDILHAVRERTVGGVVFDLSSLEFIDSMGMSLIIRAHDAVAPSGNRLAVQGAGGRVREALERAGFGGLISLE